MERRVGSSSCMDTWKGWQEVVILHVWPCTLSQSNTATTHPGTELASGLTSVSTRNSMNLYLVVFCSIIEGLSAPTTLDWTISVLFTWTSCHCMTNPWIVRASLCVCLWKCRRGGRKRGKRVCTFPFPALSLFVGSTLSSLCLHSLVPVKFVSLFFLCKYSLLPSSLSALFWFCFVLFILVIIFWLICVI